MTSYYIVNEEEAAIRTMRNFLKIIYLTNRRFSLYSTKNELSFRAQPLDLLRNYNYDLELIKKIGSFFLLT